MARLSAGWRPAGHHQVSSHEGARGDHIWRFLGWAPRAVLWLAERIRELEHIAQFQPSRLVLDRPEQLPPRPALVPGRAPGGFGPDRSHRYWVSLVPVIWHRLPLHDGRRLVARRYSTAQTQLLVW